MLFWFIFVILMVGYFVCSNLYGHFRLLELFLLFLIIFVRCLVSCEITIFFLLFMCRFFSMSY